MTVPSYVHGSSEVPLLGDTIGDNLRRTVERFGDREAVVVPHQRYRATYRQLWEQTGNEIPNVGYAAVYPEATIAKILLVQLLVDLS